MQAALASAQGVLMALGANTVAGSCAQCCQKPSIDKVGDAPFFYEAILPLWLLPECGRSNLQGLTHGPAASPYTSPSVTGGCTMTGPTAIRGALMRFLIVTTNPRKFRWLTAWTLMITAPANGTEGRANAIAVVTANADSRPLLVMNLRQVKRPA